jgi:hypothetical protein
MLILDSFSLMESLKTSQFVQYGGHIIVIICHCRLQEFLLNQSVEDGCLGQCPITRAWVDLICTFPYLKLFVKYPDTVTPQAVRDTVNEVNYCFIFLKI